jgi:hypothetical protein
MSEIDWSRAPEGAERYCDGYVYPWLKLNSGQPQYFCGSSWRNCAADIGRWCRATPRPTEQADVAGSVKNMYLREILPGVHVDVYQVLDAFKTESSAVDHAVKKCLAPGKRGVKDRIQDLKEARKSLDRAIEDAELWGAAK